MEKTLLLHNQGAGDEDYFKSELVQAIERKGFSCTYFSIKKDDSWKEEINQADFIIVAGGDGTIRRFVKELMKRRRHERRIPLAILPMGTANNLSRSLNFKSELNIADHTRNWKNNHLISFDVGEIQNADRADYFLEGAGYGLFPDLIHKMDSTDLSHLKDAEDQLKFALKEFHRIVLTAKAAPFQIKANDQLIEGKALLLEVMNIPSVGPNLVLAPKAQTDDGLFDIVVVQEEQRKEFANFIKKLIDGEEVSWKFTKIKTQHLTVDCKSEYMHIDDQLIVNSQNPSTYILQNNALNFLQG